MILIQPILQWMILAGCSVRALSPAPNVWKVFSDLARQTGSVDLGLGFPDWSPPQFVLDSLHGATSHQYTRSAGKPELVQLLAETYGRHIGRYIDPMSEVAVTVGASQALYLALTTILKKNDEIIVFEPFFELYSKQIALTGATPVYVQLGGEAASSSDPWALDVDQLKRAVNERTKILLLNSPHNPTGKVFTLSELKAIAEIVRQYPNLVVISDEVYKYTVHSPFEEGDKYSVGHYHFARLPDMWERTITISSCGKTFSATGWQVGWMVGPDRFIGPVQTLLPCVQFCTSAPAQDALCKALVKAAEPYEDASSYYEWLRCQFLRKKEILSEGLLSAGIVPMPSQGGFFLMGRLPKSLSEQSVKGEPYDWTLCKRLAMEHGVVGVPASPFYSSSAYLQEPGAAPLARFAFCKQDTTLVEACRRLRIKSYIP